ncbi:hypothetical protein [Streptomyces bikiniensis]|uniref:hypothetical protein n=1 Tax=Streptomyces bikiniensis TaxID=1896 RepID=UPI000B02458C|nr:hypothetical protein [Streptomyces bikiniensis]
MTPAPRPITAQPPDWADRGDLVAARAVDRLGITRTGETTVMNDTRVVIGVLEPPEPVPNPDRVAMAGFPAAERHFGFDGRPTTVSERSTDAAVEDVRAIPACTTASPRYRS